MKSNDLPLLELFIRLRQAGLPLGMTEYQLVVQALQAGFGLPDKDALGRLCRTLWVKSEDDQPLFDYHFDAVMVEDAASLLSAEKSLVLPQPEASKKTLIRRLWQKVSLPIGLVLGGSTLIVGASIAFWVTRPPKECPFFTSSPPVYVNRGEPYRYEIKAQACETSSNENLEISAVDMHPWLSLKPQQDGSAVVIGRVPDHDIRYSDSGIWNLKGEKLADFNQSEDIAGIGFSEDEHFLITHAFNKTAKLWDTQGNQIADFNGLSTIETIYIVRESNVIVTQLSDKTAQLWNAKGQQLAELGSIINGRDSLQVSNNGQLLIVRSSDETAQLWNTQGQQLARFFGLDKQNPIQFMGNGESLITLSIGNTVQWWDAQGKQLAKFEDIEKGRTELRMSFDGQSLVTLSPDKTAKLWNSKGKLLAQLGKFSSHNGDVQFVAEGKSLIVRTTEDSVNLWSTQGKLLTNLGKIKDFGKDIKFSENFLVTRAPNKMARLWDADGQRIANLGKISDSRRQESLQFSQDRKLLVTHSPNGTVQLWTTKGKPIASLGKIKNQQNRYPSVQFMGDDQSLLTYSSDRTWKLWNVQGKKIADLGKFGRRYDDLQLSDDKKKLVVRSPDNAATMWTSLGQKISDFEGLNNIESIVMSQDGQKVSTYSSDEITIIWNSQGKRISDLGNDELNIYGFTHRFIANGQLLAVSSAERKVYLLNLQGNQIANFENVIGLSAESLDDEFNRRGNIINFQQSLRNNDVINSYFMPQKQLLVTLTGRRNFTLKVIDKVTNQENEQKFSLLSFNDSSAFTGQFQAWLWELGAYSTAFILLLLPSLYLLVRLISNRYNKPTNFPTLPKSKETSKTAISALNENIEDEIQLAQSVHQPERQSVKPVSNPLNETGEYFPVTSRQMQQSWRQLRRLIREGPAIELDIEATVQRVSRQGLLLHPVFRSRRVNRNELLLLVDQEGSMVPFHALSERLAKTAIHGGRLANTAIHYFHNCPDDYLYRDPYHQIAQPVEEVLAEFHPEYTGVLIFSDAGAARGIFNQQRLELTTNFLTRLRQNLHYVVWLNPMPRSRWRGTAGEISKLVPMFELSHKDLNKAIDVLRGKHSYQGS